MCRVGLVAADDDLEQVGQRQAGKRELDGDAPLRGHQAEPPALRLQRREHVRHPGAELERVVQRLVVRAVDADELVDPILGEHRHLRLEPGAADRREQLLIRVFAPEDGARSMAHRGEDDPAGIDDGPVEIEQNDRVAHAVDRSLTCPGRNVSVISLTSLRRL